MSEYLRHEHGDAHHLHQHNHTKKHLLAKAFFITLGFSFIELIFGWFSGSLALMADAGHMVSDSAALGLAYGAQKIASRPANDRLSFGFTRVEILSAFLNNIFMVVIVAWIIFEALTRFSNPHPVEGKMVIIVAVIGLILNLYVASLLHQDHESMNSRAAFIHVLGDILGSIAAIVAGVVIMKTGWMPIDPILSILVALLILRSTIPMLKESVWHLLDAVPKQINYQQVGKSLEQIEGIRSVHDLHIWNMSSDQPILIAHVILDEKIDWPPILEQCRGILKSSFGIEHVTLQAEWAHKDVDLEHVQNQGKSEGLGHHDDDHHGAHHHKH